MKFEKVQPGQVLYDVGRRKMGHTTMSTVAVWRVRVESVDPATRSVMASWNSNPVKRYYERDVRRWRVKEPVLIKTGLTYRLARRDEVPAVPGDET